MIKIDRERLSGAIRQRRAAERLTFAAAAEQVGCMAPSTLYRIETGKGLPSADGLLALCFWLDRDPRDFSIRVAA